jgi:hypothetical protein
MSTVKLNKLFSTFKKKKGTQQTFVISTKDLNITVSGEVHNIDNQYYSFTKGVGKVVIEEEKAGSMLSWKGTYKHYMVKFMVGNETLAEFAIPKNAKLTLSNIEEAQQP